MSTSDSIMLDSPAQTPTPKSHLHAPNPSINLSAEIATDNTATAAGIQGLWDTRKHREECAAMKIKLLHQNFELYRDPMDKPLVTQPRDLSPEVGDRLRKHFQARVGRNKME